MRLDIFNGYIAYITLFIVLILISKEIVLSYKHYYIIISAAAANLYFVLGLGRPRHDLKFGPQASCFKWPDPGYILGNPT